MARPTFNTILRAIFALALTLYVSASFADRPTVRSGNQVIFPPDLKWAMMTSVTYNFAPQYAVPKEDPRLKLLARSMWQSEVEKIEAEKSGSALFFLMGIGSTRNFDMIFSLIDIPLEYERCEPPANGKDVTDMYSKCLMRVRVRQFNHETAHEFNDFCFLHIDNSRDTPLAKNHTEFALDEMSNRAFFRVIQYGKVVPACNRSMHFR